MTPRNTVSFMISVLSLRIRLLSGLFSGRARLRISRTEISTRHICCSVVHGPHCLAGAPRKSREKMPIDSSKISLALPTDLRVLLLRCACLVSLSFPTATVRAADISHRSLMCDGTRFTITNTYDPAAFIKAQTLEGRRGQGPVFRIDLRNRRSGDSAAIFGFVSSWVCHRTRRVAFLDLLYVCDDYMKRTDIEQYCGGDQNAEWGRYIGLDGQLLDPGYRIENLRYRELDRRLGVSEVGVQDMLRAD